MSFLKIFSPSLIRNQLNKTSNYISSGISNIFKNKKLDSSTLEELEDILLSSDMGVEASREIIENLKSKKFDREISDSEIKDFLSNELYKILLPCQKTLEIKENLKPQVIIFNGVNGVGKTTTIGKIAKKLTSSNKKVLIAACDTFRAAAASQLEVWAERSNCKIIQANKEGEDPASVAYRALSEAKKSETDILLIDTAGRLQNKQNLMDELKKINQVLKKIDPESPHENILVLDATTGQNTKNQLEIFDKIVNISGIIITKLDGSAKGGILIALAKKFSKPIYAIGIGEQIEDLQEFSAKEFTQNLFS